MFAGSLEVRDLPEAWNAQYRELLGVQPPDDGAGVLQDIHWAMGAFGYFPTYALGNLMAAQLFEAAQRDLGDLELAFAQGDFTPLRGWLRAQIHVHGRRWTSADLLRKATGQELSPQPFLRALRQRLGQVYPGGG